MAAPSRTCSVTVEEKDEQKRTCPAPPERLRPPAQPAESERSERTSSGSSSQFARANASAQAKSEVIKRMSNAELGAALGDIKTPTAERLAWAFKIHLCLCGQVNHAALDAKINQMAEDELIVPLLALARVPHSLNYIVFRTILLFTFTTKAIRKLADNKVIPLVMHTLRRPQEPTCLRFSIAVLQRVCTSVHCRTIEILSQLVHQDAITLWNIINHHKEIAFARLPVLKILSSMLLTHRGRQALLRAGSVYGVLDLLSQHKKGQGYFTHREIATLDMLKRELLFWEEVFARGWQHVVDKRTQHEQRLLEKKAERKSHSPVRRLGAERPDDPRTHERAEGGEQGAPDDANNALEDLEDEATDQEREKEQNQLSTGSSGSGDDPQEASAAGGGTSWSFVSTTRAAR